jgi:hypothetical protein
MALELLALVVEFVFGPLFLLGHLFEAPAVLGNAGHLFGVLANGGVEAFLVALAGGEFGLATRALASGAGTLAWLALAATALGGLGDVADLDGLLDVR